MQRARHILEAVNGFLRPLNLQLETLTAERQERARLLALVKAGHFDAPSFPLLRCFAKCDPSFLLHSVKRFKRQTERFLTPASERYSYVNDYFTSSDAEIAYAVLHNYHPNHVIEVGSGNSTLLFREAINDGELRTKVTSIDPAPRRDISTAADSILTQRLEDISAEWIRETLEVNGILFIDSSHIVRPGNDVTCLLLTIIPMLAPGTIIHFHDIFLPFDYPKDWLVEFGRDWNEQYLIQATLQCSDQFEVLWAGHFFQRTWPDFETHFSAERPSAASSLWLRKLV